MLIHTPSSGLPALIPQTRSTLSANFPHGALERFTTIVESGNTDDQYGPPIRKSCRSVLIADDMEDPLFPTRGLAASP